MNDENAKNFILKVSPLLTYYDLGAERVTYLGNSQFNSDELIEELSLQGSFFSSNEELTKTDFIKNWEKKWGFKPSFLNVLANDITSFANKLSLNDCVVLSTAHPCKFPDATENAIKKHENLPKELEHVLNKDENFEVLKNDIEVVKNFVRSKI